MKKFSKLFLGVSLLTATVLSSCSKDSSSPIPGGPSNDKTAKLTFTVTSDFQKSEGDNFEVTVGAGDASGKFIDWMVNGTRKTGTIVTVGTDDFNGGKTITIESASKFFSGNVDFGGFEHGDTPFTVTWKIEVNGKTIEEGTQKVVEDMSPIFSKNVQFKN